MAGRKFLGWGVLPFPKPGMQKSTDGFFRVFSSISLKFYSRIAFALA